MLTTRRLFPSAFLFMLLTASLLSVAQSPLRFVPVTPCRVVDTRLLPNGPFKGPSIPALGSRDFAIPQGPCGIPSNAAAYALNATVIPYRHLGYLTVWPTGTDAPGNFDVECP